MKKGFIVVVLIAALLLILCSCFLDDYYNDENAETTKHWLDEITYELSDNISDGLKELEEVEDMTEMPDMTETSDTTRSLDTINVPDATTASDTKAPNTTKVPDATKAPDTTKAPNTTEAPGKTVPEPSSIKILSVTSPVRRNETATLKIQGEPNTKYYIEVYYTTTASKAKGLEAKTSDSNGIVSWSWKVGGKTIPGTFTIDISGGNSKVRTQFTVIN